MARDLDHHGLLVRALMACGYVASHDVITAPPYFAEALGLARALDDRWALSHILVYQAYVAYIAGEPVTARAASEEALQLADSIGDRYAARHSRWTLSMALMLRGDLSASLTQIREVKADAVEAHDTVPVAPCLVHGGLHSRLFR
jgi:hypothetical protein